VKTRLPGQSSRAGLVNLNCADTIITRALSLLLGLGILLAGLWGPNLKGEAVIAGLALLSVALIARRNLQRTIVLLLLWTGFASLIVLVVSAIRETKDMYELALQLFFLVVGAALLGNVGFREGKDWLRQKLR